MRLQPRDTGHAAHGVVRAASRDASRIDRASCVAINVGGDCRAEELKARLRVKFDGA